MTSTLEKLKAVREALVFAHKWVEGNPAVGEEISLSIQELDTLIAEQVKGACRSDLPNKNSCLSDNAKNERQNAQQQPVSSLVADLELIVNLPISNEYDRAYRNGAQACLEKVHQHTREPDVEAGARAIAESMRFECSIDYSYLFGVTAFKKMAQACIAAAWKGDGK